MTSFDEFLDTGRLGQVAEGRTTQEVRDLLGEPDYAPKLGSPQLWKYGSLQLGFFRTSTDESPFLVSIGLYFRTSEESLPKALGATGWFPAVGCTYDEFRAHLDQASLKVVGGVTVGPQKHLVLGPGVRVNFDDDVLDSIQYASKREPSRKQITISVPRDLLASIRSEARSLGVSASTLCSQWIEERAKAATVSPVLKEQQA